MATAVWLLSAAALAVALAFVVRAWMRWRGARVITCPETRQPAGVRVDAWHAALGRLAGGAELRLEQCSRWPEKRNCGQECLSQIEAAPDGCLVTSLLSRWYSDKKCVYCGKPLGEINWHERRPALLSPAGKTVEWRDLRAEHTPEALAVYRPVCWNCHIVETFRQEHPELVIERPG
jgi:hypothetical protein